MLLHYFDAHRDGFTVDDAGERHQSSSDESDAVFFEGRDGAAVVEDPVLPRSLLVLRLLLLLLLLLLGGGGRSPREGERHGANGKDPLDELPHCGLREILRCVFEYLGCQDRHSQR